MEEKYWAVGKYRWWICVDTTTDGEHVAMLCASWKGDANPVVAQFYGWTEGDAVAMAQVFADTRDTLGEWVEVNPS